MSALPIAEAAKALEVSEGTLRRWVLVEKCPIARQGRRGRGCAMLIDPEAVRAWRTARVTNDPLPAQVQELASALPQVLADATFTAFVQIEDDPEKRRMAGVLAGAWFVMACAVVDHLRKLHPSLPEVRTVPEPIERLEKISKLR